jgi:hypothetical protein
MKAARYAVVTPYYKEARESLERCVASVRRQTVNADHILVSDGFAQDWLGAVAVHHLRLGRCHADFGNTPRSLGAMLAIAQHYDAIGFLDADNWYDEDHIEACVEAAASLPDTDAVIARRRIVRDDGSVMSVAEEQDHVDTSCFWLCEGSLHLAHFWLMPVQVAPICDRVYYAMIKARNLTLGHVPKPTVNYTCTWRSIYRALGETPPPGAKPDVDVTSIFEWLIGLSERRRRLVALQCGVDLVPFALQALGKAGGAAPQRGRNELCSCGSGRKYKHCHGTIGESGAPRA